MTLSIWRYAHLALAVISSIFLVMASVTGAIISVDAIQEKSNLYSHSKIENQNLAETISSLKKNYSEVSEITIDYNSVMTIKAFDNNDNEVEGILNPNTSKIIGKTQKKSEFIQWITSLHRSLFLHETGRIFVGVMAFILTLIAVSGCMLIIQRQSGILLFFSRIGKDYFYQYYHVITGRFLLIPILIIGLSGTTLSLMRFKVFQEQKIEHNIPKTFNENQEQKDQTQFSVFKNIKLSDVKKVEFPFPDDPEEFFKIKLKDRELLINQFDGNIVSEIFVSKAAGIENLSLDLHTGRGNIVWATILGISSLNILFFIFSGFAITLKRKSGTKIKNKYKAKDSEVIILVGSENGSTVSFAHNIHQQLLDQGYSSYLDFMNHYTHFPNAQHILVFTSTYGLGDAPSSATKFLSLLQKVPQKQDVKVSVVGFGSQHYSDFCGFAKIVDTEMRKEKWAETILSVFTVDGKSPTQFIEWVKSWTSKTGIPLKTTPAVYNQKPKGLQNMFILEKTEISSTEHTFLLTIAPKMRSNFTSGDILAIYPANDHRERLYSIGKKNGNIQLKVKLHSEGLGSEYLNSLKAGSIIKARIVENNAFHLPKKAKKVVMIANGTGIAPFLGMVHQNKRKIETHLYCGFRNETAMVTQHKIFMKDQIGKKKLKTFHIAFSKEQNHCYVIDLIERDADFFAKILAQNGTVMMCGALVMQKDVERVLDTIVMEKNSTNLEYYKKNGQILVDCY